MNPSSRRVVLIFGSVVAVLGVVTAIRRPMPVRIADVECSSAADCAAKGDAVGQPSSSNEFTPDGVQPMIDSLWKQRTYYEKGCEFNPTGFTCQKLKGTNDLLANASQMKAQAVRAQQLSKP
jgi:hypothetical protein